MRDHKCYTCTHVLAATRPVLYVCRDEGDLIMSCGGDDHEQSTDEWKVVHPAHVLDRDPSLAEVAGLGDSEQAERSEVGGPWAIGPITG